MAHVSTAEARVADNCVRFCSSKPTCNITRQATNQPAAKPLRATKLAGQAASLPRRDSCAAQPDSAAALGTVVEAARRSRPARALRPPPMTTSLLYKCYDACACTD